MSHCVTSVEKKKRGKWSDRRKYNYDNIIKNTIVTLQNGDNKPITPDKTNSDSLCMTNDNVYFALRKMYRFYYDFVPETLMYDNDDTKFVEHIATYIAKHRLSFTV